MEFSENELDDLNKRIVLVDTYLFQNYNYKIKRKLQNKTKLAIIIETRCHYRLVPTIVNVLSFLDDEYDLLFIGSVLSFYYVKTNLPDLEFYSEILEDHEILWTQYSEILTSKSLFEKYNYENIFIFQTNSLLFKPLPQYIYDFDYIGPCDYMISNDDDIHIIYHGGISFRKRSFILKCLNTYSHEDITKKRKELNMYTSDEHDIYPECFYYSQCLSLFTYNTLRSLDPTITYFFGQNSFPDFEKNKHQAGALHGYDKVAYRYLTFKEIYHFFK